ncbi:hypothetical protein ZOSMA_12G00670 [Zostera marina]|uniref:Uncharacterized protein n=1 Tax=Zostera marina TaxID=29655 RepID=A0A0K9Q1H0_ZOSMR|nr:hypothetical protein ZOSMA_12G00670 [Zostera marina]
MIIQAMTTLKVFLKILNPFYKSFLRYNYDQMCNRTELNILEEPVAERNKTSRLKRKDPWK